MAGCGKDSGPTAGLEPARLGRLQVAIGGLPPGVAANVMLTGPGGYSRSITAAAAVGELIPGTYELAADPVTSNGDRYLPAPVRQAVAVAAGETAAAGPIGYSIGTGRLELTVEGVPAGGAARVTVSGPGGFADTLEASATLKGLVPGTYVIAAAGLTQGNHGYAAMASPESVVVAAGVTPASVAVTYAVATAALTVELEGLPAGVPGSVTVSGPGGSQPVPGTTTLYGLVPGSYRIDATDVSAATQSWVPTPGSQTVTLPPGTEPVVRKVSYVVPQPPPSLNLAIDGMYLTQAAQRYDGTTPLVAGRDGYLRVFVRANQSNTATPAVRVRFYSGGTLLQTSTIAAPNAGVPTAVSEGTLASSWNMPVPAALVRPGLRILADVDPANIVAEAGEADNEYPLGGTPFAVDVRVVSPLQLRFVPVLQEVNGLQGNVTGGNAAQYLADALKLLPIAAYDTDIRAVYTTTAPAVQADNGNAAWGTILSELLALRTADGSTRYYYGVLKAGYASGVAGIGYVGGGARTALGWDRLPSGAGVMAHELGHNMGRSHAPCGGVAVPDPAYPHAGGRIGIWGLDVATLVLKSPATTFDLMGYCNPDWVSDYSWAGMLQYRQSDPLHAPPRAVGPVGGLLVWGRVTATGVVLEPAFRVDAPVGGLGGPGRVRIEGLSVDGRVVFSAGVATVGAVDDRHRPEEHFAAVLPLDAAVEGQLGGLRVVSPGGVAVRMSAQAVAQRGRQLFLREPRVSTSRPNAAQADLRWDAATYPMALVRDAATGQILSFARGGRVVLWTEAAALDVTFSDGARTLRARVRP